MNDASPSGLPALRNRLSQRLNPARYWPGLILTLLTLTAAMVFIGLSLVAAHTGVASARGQSALTTLPLLLTVVTLPLTALAVLLSVRRLHDAGYRGWWVLLVLLPGFGPLLLLPLLLRRGDSERNRYGPAPARRPPDRKSTP